MLVQKHLRGGEATHLLVLHVGSIPASIVAVTETPVWSTFLEGAGRTELRLDSYILTFPEL